MTGIDARSVERLDLDDVMSMRRALERVGRERSYRLLADPNARHLARYLTAPPEPTTAAVMLYLLIHQKQILQALAEARRRWGVYVEDLTIVVPQYTLFPWPDGPVRMFGAAVEQGVPDDLLHVEWQRRVGDRLEVHRVGA